MPELHGSNYLKFAVRCAKIARLADNPDEAEAFRAMAQIWTRLADDEERLANLVRDADTSFATFASATERNVAPFWEGREKKIR